MFVSIIRITQMHCLDRMLLFLILQQAVRIVTTKLKRLSFRWTIFQFQTTDGGGNRHKTEIAQLNVAQVQYRGT